ALGLAPFPDAATVLVNQFADRDAQGQLDGAGPVYVAADVIQFRPVAAGVARVLRVGRHADRLEPLVALVDDVRHAGERLDVVDDRRLAEGALDGGKGRFDARPGALAFETLDQAGLLAADVGAGATVEVYVEVEAAAEDVLAQQAMLVRLGDGL